jgi:hypothetical protein
MSSFASCLLLALSGQQLASSVRWEAILRTGKTG